MRGLAAVFVSALLVASLVSPAPRSAAHPQSAEAGNPVALSAGQDERQDGASDGYDPPAGLVTGARRASGPVTSGAPQGAPTATMQTQDGGSAPASGVTSAGAVAPSALPSTAGQANHFEEAPDLSHAARSNHSLALPHDPRHPSPRSSTGPQEPRSGLRVRERTVRAPVRTQAAVGSGLRGGASYYGTGGPGKYAAMGRYRDGTRVVAVVTAFHDGHTWSVTVPVVTQCAACRWEAGATLIDLSVPAWLDLGYPLSRGIAPVTVEILEGEPW